MWMSQYYFVGSSNFIAAPMCQMFNIYWNAIVLNIAQFFLFFLLWWLCSFILFAFFILLLRIFNVLFYNPISIHCAFKWCTCIIVQVYSYHISCLKWPENDNKFYLNNMSFSDNYITGLLFCNLYLVPLAAVIQVMARTGKSILILPLQGLNPDQVIFWVWWGNQPVERARFNLQINPIPHR